MNLCIEQAEDEVDKDLVLEAEQLGDTGGDPGLDDLQLHFLHVDLQRQRLGLVRKRGREEEEGKKEGNRNQMVKLGWELLGLEQLGLLVGEASVLVRGGALRMDEMEWNGMDEIELRALEAEKKKERKKEGLTRKKPPDILAVARSQSAYLGFRSEHSAKEYRRRGEEERPPQPN